MSLDRVVFRTADPNDIEAIRKLASEIWADCYESILGRAQIAYMLSMMYDAETIRDEMARGVVWELGFGKDAGKGSEPVAFLALEHDRVERTVKLHKLYLKTCLHGQGVGRQLIDRVLAAAVTEGAGHVWLQVNRRNDRAIRAYQRSGFEITEQTVVDIGGGFVMDDYTMTRRVGDLALQAD